MQTAPNRPFAIRRFSSTHITLQYHSYNTSLEMEQPSPADLKTLKESNKKGSEIKELMCSHAVELDFPG